eukprot:25508-Eustigmatos_ZCMA.PRE.1
MLMWTAPTSCLDTTVMWESIKQNKAGTKESFRTSKTFYTAAGSLRMTGVCNRRSHLLQHKYIVHA